MSKQIRLPLVQLPPREIYFPGSLLNISCTRQQAEALLSRFKRLVGPGTDAALSKFINSIEDIDDDDQSLPSDPISREAVAGFETCKREFGKADSTEWLVVACLPGCAYNSPTKVATVCRVLTVFDRASSVEIKCLAFTRGQVSRNRRQQTPVDEIDLKLQLRPAATTKIMLNTAEAVKLCHATVQFVEMYTKALFSKAPHRSRREQLRRNFLLLSPLANVLYSHLTRETETVEAITKLAEDFAKSQSAERKLLTADCLCAIFPFTLAQKRTILFAFERAERCSELDKLFEFGNNVFKELEDLSLITDNWVDLKNKSAKTKIITTHLRSLKFLVDDFNNKNGTQAASSSNALVPFSQQNRQQQPAPQNQQSNSDEDEEMDKLAKFIQDLESFNISADGKKLILKDYKRLQKMSPNNSEYHLLYSYLEIVQDIPWNSASESPSQIDLEKARAQLDRDHYGLENIKERVLEYLAILNLHQKIKSSARAKAPILLLTGPPGVGKTSLAKSVATTLGRKFQRISLGGLKDESEIKGHRRTYVGAMPGLIIQALRKAQSNNPVILLDEIDKVVGGNATGNKVNGDPAAALLEVLDPEQNVNFSDHYIGFPVDLSNVIFLCTSNDHYLLSPPLLDRMELLEINGYNYLEKVQIARHFILPRQIERAGLPSDAVQLDDDVLLRLCTDYTRESGVRNLERTVGAICRGKAIEYSKLMPRDRAGDKLPPNYHAKVSQDQVAMYIGIPPHIKEELKLEQELSSKSGVVNGLSYNSDGSGSKLIFEMIAVPSQGGFQMNMTGRLGEVLRESCKISISLVKSILNEQALNKENDKALSNLNSHEFHLHVPAGSISKDGPSAGITMAMCLMSLVLDRPVPYDIAMTGEITLRGLVLPIGGVMEKLLGAHLTQKVKKVLLPRLNRKDIIEAYLKTNKQNTETVLKQESEALENGVKNIYGEPEKYIMKNFGIAITYVEELNDVFKACWGDEDVFVVKRQPDSALHL